MRTLAFVCLIVAKWVYYFLCLLRNEYRKIAFRNAYFFGDSLLHRFSVFFLGLLLEGQCSKYKSIEAHSEWKQVSGSSFLMVLFDLRSQIVSFVNQVTIRKPCFAFKELNILNVDKAMQNTCLMQLFQAFEQIFNEQNSYIFAKCFLF